MRISEFSKVKSVGSKVVCIRRNLVSDGTVPGW